MAQCAGNIESRYMSLVGKHTDLLPVFTGDASVAFLCIRVCVRAYVCELYKCRCWQLRSLFDYDDAFRRTVNIFPNYLIAILSVNVVAA